MARIAAALFATCALYLVVAYTDSLKHEPNKLLKPTSKKPYVYHPENLVDINGTNYYFAPDYQTTDFSDSRVFCHSMGMRLIGLETQQEWDDVFNYMNANGMQYVYWTSAIWIENTTWMWLYSGVTFDSSDPRWDYSQPQPYDNAGVVIYVEKYAMQAREFWLGYRASCEGTPTVDFN